MGIFSKKDQGSEQPAQPAASPQPEQQVYPQQQQPQQQYSQEQYPQQQYPQQQYTPMNETPASGGAPAHGAAASPGPEIQQSYYAPPQQAQLPPYDQKAAANEQQGQYFPPQQGQQPQLNQVVPLHSLQGHASPVDCPVCGTRAITATDYESGFVTHGLALVLCFCFCLGCIPYFFSSLKNVHHRCSRCGASLATYHRDGGTDVHAQQQ